MAEILIKTKNVTHSDLEKDRRGCYQRGYPVVVFEDGHIWGREESKQVWIVEGKDPAQWEDKFCIVKIPGLSVLKVQALIEAQTEDDAGNPLIDAQGMPIVYRRRRWKILVDNIPPAILNQLKNAGEVTVIVSQIRNYIKRIRDNVQYVGLD